MIRKVLKSFTNTNKYMFSTSETQVFFESVTSTVKGFLNPNYIK